MSMSFDSSCRELKRDIIMLNFNASFMCLLNGLGQSVSL